VRVTWSRLLIRVTPEKILSFLQGCRGAWDNSRAKRYQRSTGVRDALTLRKNAYRVLLTRGRDGTVVFVPPVAELDETAALLEAAGCRLLATPG